MLNTSEKVSVIIPSYNCAAFIRDAVESVLAQSYEPYEIIVIDDGSSDHTEEILTPYIEKGLVRYFYQDNGGISNARNFGISKGSGRYIMLLDADDTLMTNAMAETVRSIEHNKSDWVIVNNIRVEDGREEVRKPRLPDREDPFVDALRNPPDYNAILFRKKTLEKFGGYDPQQKVYEDWDLYLRLLKNGVPFSYVDQPLYRYQIRSGSVTKIQNFRRNLHYVERIYQKHCKDLLHKGNVEMAHLYSLKMWRLGSDYFRKTGDVLSALRCGIMSARYDHRNWTGYLKKISRGAIQRTKHMFHVSIVFLESAASNYHW